MANADALRAKLVEGANRIMEATVEDVHARLAEAWNAVVKEHTGDPHLLDTWYQQQSGDSPRVAWTFGFTAPQGEWLEEGTQPHAIFPREPGGVLHWVNDVGEDVFAKYVLNNYLAARPWFNPALDEMWPGVLEANQGAAGW